MTNPESNNPNYMIPDYFKNPVLRPYLSNVRDWQGYIRFLGLPDRRDHPDVIIDRLFVEPLLTRRYVSPDENPENWLDEAETLLDALSADTPLMLLGDPGIGKSTLLNNVAWLLSRPTENALISRLGWRLPLPMVLRELPIRKATDFDGLLEAFLNQEMSAPLCKDDGRYVRQALADGQAFLLLDGIDEIGDRSARKDLRRAIFDGMARYPGCRWLLSSRIVGYDEVPFDTMRSRSDEKPYHAEWSAEVHKGFQGRIPRDLHRTTGASIGVPVATRYIAPFDDRRIVVFARNWYVQREAAATRAGANAGHLVQAVHADESILRLARVPNLLTMMALIHRIEATLPHGRALLYERIAEAYLESIDKFRGIDLGPHDLPRKKGWLARVGFEMQRRRTSEDDADGSEMLVDVDTVKCWLSEEMDRGEALPGSPSAAEFLKIVGRRSGLFLPRSEGRYAFVHLSFQEYFAAFALEREVTRLRWARDKDSRLGFDCKLLTEWAGKSVWRETFAFLFELLALKEEDDWHADLLRCVFGQGWSRLNESMSNEQEALSTQQKSVSKKREALNIGNLLARLVVNSRSGLSAQERDDAIASCIEAQLRVPFVLRPQSIFQGLLGNDVELNAKVFEEMGRANIHNLDLVGVQIPDFMPLANLTTLKWLDLDGTQVSDLSPLASLTALESLNLNGTQVLDLSPLANLSTLESLNLRNMQVRDFSPLINLTALRRLNLWDTPISNLSSLSNLTELIWLDLDGTQVSDLSPLVNLTALESLDLNGTQVSDLSPLANLTALESLNLRSIQVADFSPLTNLTALRRLNLWDTLISNLSSLSNLTSLKWLDLDGTQISVLSPLANLTSLERLDLNGTQVSDLSPLADLTALKWLDLDGTLVSALSPLSNLTKLEYLSLNGTSVSTSEIEELRYSLADLRISYWSEDEEYHV